MTEVVQRCRWAVEHPELIAYHDEVWGTETHDDRAMLAAYGQCVLHAGLLWTAMLKKRPEFAAAFDDWDIARVAAYDGVELARLLEAPGLIHNAVKLRSVIWNAGRMQAVAAEYGTFAAFIWRASNEVVFDGNHDEPEARRTAEHLSRELQAWKFKFAGPATAYGFMEDIGMVNDHDPACFRALSSTGE